jgi:hypothetical protein
MQKKLFPCLVVIIIQLEVDAKIIFHTDKYAIVLDGVKQMYSSWTTVLVYLTAWKELVV